MGKETVAGNLDIKVIPPSDQILGRVPIHARWATGRLRCSFERTAGQMDSSNRPGKISRQASGPSIVSFFWNLFHTFKTSQLAHKKVGRITPKTVAASSEARGSGKKNEKLEKHGYMKWKNGKKRTTVGHLRCKRKAGAQQEQQEDTVSKHAVRKS